MSDHTLLFPSQGYFGETDSDCLKIAVGSAIHGLELWVAAPEPEILNLRGLKAFHRGKQINLEDYVQECTQSSTYNDDPRYGGISLIKCQAIHSKRELHPKWTVRFKQGLTIDTLCVYNRGDRWGGRSSRLAVGVTRADGSTETLSTLDSADRAAETLLAVLNAAGALCTETPVTLSSLRELLIERIAARLHDGSVEIGSIEWPVLMRLLPLWKSRALTSAELTVLAARAIHDKVQYKKSALTDICFPLTTPDEISEFENILNSLSEKYGHGKYVVTRHGLQVAKLQTNPEKYLALLKEVLKMLDEQTVTPVLAYGTLLGAVRDRQFIAHDDDVDVLYKVDCVRSEVDEKVNELLSQFQARGYQTVRFPGTFNAHIVDPLSEVSVDIFPSWTEKDGLALHMEKMAIRSIDENIVFPPKSIRFYGEDFPIPHSPEEFLVARYGNSWGSPNKFFEWPWPLQEKKQ